MKFQVTWRAEALDRLADEYLLMSPDDREILSREVESLNAHLSADGDVFGESREGLRRVGFSGSVCAYFFVQPGTEVVRVTDFWLRS